MGAILVTGTTGEPVTAEMDRALHSCTYGRETYVAATGRMFEAEIQSNNMIKVYDGNAIHHGAHIWTAPNDYDEFTINNGTAGYNRIDVLAYRYTKDSEGIERIEPVTIQGTETNGNPMVPEVETGNILDGTTVSDMALYEVELEGLNIVEVRRKFEVVLSLKQMEEKLLQKITYGTQDPDNSVGSEGDIYIKISG